MLAHKLLKQSNSILIKLPWIRIQQDNHIIFIEFLTGRRQRINGRVTLLKPAVIKALQPARHIDHLLPEQEPDKRTVFPTRAT